MTLVLDVEHSIAAHGLIAEILQVLPEAACLPGDPFGITTIICSALPSVIRLSMTEETTSPSTDPTFCRASAPRGGSIDRMAILTNLYS